MRFIQFKRIPIVWNLYSRKKTQAAEFHRRGKNLSVKTLFKLKNSFWPRRLGLGLGIVQSLVRLMGVEIRIVDKEHGEKGTCFWFNEFLTCDAESTETDEQGNYIHSGGTSNDVLHYIGLHIRSPMPRLEGSLVILLLAGEERRKISRKVMENFGVKVSVAKRSNDLLCILGMIKQKMDFLQCSSSELSPVDYQSTSSNSNLAPNEGSSSTEDENGHIFAQKKSNSKNSVNFLLIAMDANAGPFTELCSIVSGSKKETPNIRCKLVWLENPIIQNGNSRKPGENRPIPLYEVLRLVPEFSGDPLKVKQQQLLQKMSILWTFFLQTTSLEFLTEVSSRKV